MEFIQPMLAVDYSKTKHKKYKEFIAQPKYDGVRAVFHDGVLQTRYGNIYEGVPEVLETLSDLDTLGFPIDGELYSDELDFDTISGICRRKSSNLSEQRKLVHFQAFDVINKTKSYQNRLNFLLSRFETSKYYRRPSGILINHDYEEVKRLLNVLLTDGYEGVILRDPDSLYEHKRSPSLLRWKPFDKDIFSVMEIAEEVSIHGRPKRRCGAIICGNKETKMFSAGGLDDILKDKIWANPNYYIGKLVVIKFQKRTKKGSLRSPNFVKFVEDEELERTMLEKGSLIE